VGGIQLEKEVVLVLDLVLQMLIVIVKLQLLLWVVLLILVITFAFAQWAALAPIQEDLARMEHILVLVLLLYAIQLLQLAQK
jgi:hypothetical protein